MMFRVSSATLLAIALLSCVCIASQPVPTYAPVPSQALGPPIPTDTGYRTESFGQGSYMITDGLYQSLFFVTNDSVIAVDAPPTIGKNLLLAIRNITSKPLSHLVYSHSHADHIAAAFLLKADSPELVIVAHQLTAEALKLVPDPHRPLPNITFQDTYILNVSNQTLELSYGGVNHEAGNIMIYAPAQKILTFIDIVFPGWIPPFYLGEAESVPGYIQAHDQILVFDFEHYIGGHLDRSGTRQDVLNNREWVHDVFESSVEAWRLSALPPNSSNQISGFFLEVPAAEADPNNSWAVAKAVFDALAKYSMNYTNTKWSGKLAGLDVYGSANANAMVQSVFVDYGVLGAFDNTE